MAETCIASTLHVIISKSRSLTLTNCLATTSPPATAIARKIIHDSRHSTTYRVSINNKKYVLKLSVPDSRSSCRDLEFEARAYQEMLVQLQGTAIPKFYGYYTGQVGLDSIGCIVLQDCGDALNEDAFTLKFEEKLKIMKLCTAVHMAGYTLPDFAEENIVRRRGVYRLIDFHRLKSHGPCGWDGDLHPDEFPDPDDPEDGRVCEYLIGYGAYMEFWKFRWEPYVDICGRKYFVDDLPSQETIDKLLRDVHRTDAVYNGPTFEQWIREYAELYPDGGTEETIEEYRRHPPELKMKMNVTGRPWRSHRDDS